MNSVQAMSASTKIEPEVDNLHQTLEQMRWKLEDQNWDFGLPQSLPPWKTASADALDALIDKSKRAGSGANVHRTVEALILEGDPDSRQRALEILQKLVAIHEVENINSVVSEHGVEYPGFATRQESGKTIYEITPPSEQRPQVFNVRNLALEYALLYLLTDDKSYADKAKAILLRFAEVVHTWPLYDRANQPHAQDEVAYLQHGNANGLWSTWAPLDLAESLTLLRAYDILRPTLTDNAQKTLEEDLFIYHKRLLDEFPLNTGYHNLVSFRLLPLIRFGQVLRRPDFIHEAVEQWRNLLRYSYAPDGFWREVTPAYHQQVTARIKDMVPPVLKGYSDPEGYEHPKTGERFDDLDLANRAAAQFERMEKGLNVLAMPDGFMVSINDDWPKGQKVPPDASGSLDRPGLLGVSGVAKLGANGMVAFLQFGGTRGHDHHDALNLVWFAGGREVFSETGYQALPGSDSSRVWHTISASHNTVAVDETDHFQSRESLKVPAGTDGKDDGLPVFGLLPEAATTANQGRLLIWNADQAMAQGMEAEQENAYPGITSLFRRSIVMVPTGQGDGYLVDIFRIVGGSSHDFFLRGGLDEPYTMSFDLPLKPHEATAYEFIQIKETGLANPPLLETTRYEDGYQVVSLLAGLFGTSSANLEVLLGEAPAIRRLGRAPVAILRRKLPGRSERLESIYVWVHVAGSASKDIRDVKVSAQGDAITVMVEREDGQDVVFSGPSDESHFSFADWQFTGRLAFGRLRGGQASGVVFSGGALRQARQTVATSNPSLNGSVISTTNADSGDPTDSLLVRLDDGALPIGLKPRLAHIDLGETIRFSIPVEKASEEEGGLRLQLAHGPGFVVDKQQLIMTSFPGWALSGAATIRLDCVEEQRSSEVKVQDESPVVN